MSPSLQTVAKTFATRNVLVCLKSRLGGLASFTVKPYSNLGESDQSPIGIRRRWGWADLPSLASGCP